MIFINKNGYPIPNILLVEGEVKKQQHIDDFSADEDNYRLNTRAVRTFPFDKDIYGHETVKELLETIQNFKCCFCESKYKHITSGDVEHFRPKAGYSQGVGLQFTRPGYFWLAYDWTNLLISCEVCNRRKKGNYFPLSNPNSRFSTYSSDITIEEPWFINPSIIDPESHITFYKEVPMHISFQGAKTIIYLELDRPELNEMRLQKLNDLKTLENSYVISVGYFKGKNDMSWLINYIRPSFEHVGSEINVNEIKNYKHNAFFKEYKEAINTGQQILKRFSYNISKTTEEKISTPPFWIDMPKMFELYVYAQLLKDNPKLNAGDLNYQFSTNGNALDFLICSGNQKIVVDAKYKLKYNYSQIHEDIRQVAGYARLNKVKNEFPRITEEIKCLIIYPKPIDDESNNNLNLISLLSDKISAYHEVFKLGINLPVI